MGLVDQPLLSGIVVLAGFKLETHKIFANENKDISKSVWLDFSLVSPQKIVLAFLVDISLPQGDSGFALICIEDCLYI